MIAISARLSKRFIRRISGQEIVTRYTVGLQASLGNQALILQARGDLDGAMALHKEEERICRELGDPAGLAISLINQAIILHPNPEARGLAREAYDTAAGHGLAALSSQIRPHLERIEG